MNQDKSSKTYAENNDHDFEYKNTVGYKCAV